MAITGNDPILQDGSLIPNDPATFLASLSTALAAGETATLRITAVGLGAETEADVVTADMDIDATRTLLSLTLTVAQVTTIVGTAKPGYSWARYRITSGSGDALVRLFAGRLRVRSKWDGVTGIALTAGASEAQSALVAANAAQAAQVAAEDALAALQGLGAVTSVNGVAPVDGAVTITKSDVGLNQVDNTADTDKPISAAQAVVNAAKADLVAGKVPASQIPDILQPGRAMIVSGLTRIYTTSRSFAGIAVPPDRRRGRVVIRNVGSNPINVATRASLIANYNVTWTGSEAVQPGQEFYSDQVAGNFYVGPDANGTAIEYEAYAEAVI